MIYLSKLTTLEGGGVAAEARLLSILKLGLFSDAGLFAGMGGLFAGMGGLFAGMGGLGLTTGV